MHQKADGKEEQFGDDLGDSRRKTQKDRQGIENGIIQRQDTAGKDRVLQKGFLPVFSMPVDKGAVEVVIKSRAANPGGNIPGHQGASLWEKEPKKGGQGQKQAVVYQEAEEGAASKGQQVFVDSGRIPQCVKVGTGVFLIVVDGGNGKLQDGNLVLAQ